MKTKKCPKCKKIKPINEFHRDYSAPIYYSSYCKKCAIENSRKWRKENPEKIKEFKRKHPEYQKIWREKHPEKVKRYKEKWEKRNPEKVQAQNKRTYERHRKKRIKQAQLYRKNHKSKRAENFKRRIKEDSQFHLNHNISGQIWQSLKGKKNNWHWEELVGYRLGKLMQRLECQFQRGMSWDNYGIWHIHHRKPRSLFKYVSPKEQAFKDCWSLANLKPLWAKENLKKWNHFNLSK